MMESGSSKPPLLLFAFHYVGTMFIWTALTGSVVTYLTVSHDWNQVVLSNFGPALTFIAMLILVLVYPTFAGDRVMTKGSAFLFPLAYAAVHICVHVALTGNLSGPFSRLEHLPGAGWRQPGLWLVAYAVTTSALLFGAASGTRPRKQ